MSWRKGAIIWMALAACVTITYFSSVKVDIMLMNLEKEEEARRAGTWRTTTIHHSADLDIGSTSTSRNNPTAPNATIVVQLSGEMGNNLHKIAFARGLQIQAMERGVLTNMILRHMDGDDSKWKRARSFISRCFPNLSHLDFEAGNSVRYKDLILQQKILFAGSASGLKLNGKSDDEVARVLDHLRMLVMMNVTIPFDETAGVLHHDAGIYLPFLIADIMVDHEYLDRFRDDFRNFFTFDDERCCAAVPDPDESVFHFRNFQHELKGVTKKRGFRELNPEQVSNELFGQLQRGDKVAIVSRFKNEITKQYVTALERRGIIVRLISGQTPVQDFCFLKRAQKEMAGSEISSFFVWASYLGKAPVRSYFVTDNRQAGKKSSYSWKNPDLKSRYTYEEYNDVDRS
jgi:hypothetical protein